jgi:hypothetical protein
MQLSNDEEKEVSEKICLNMKATKAHLIWVALHEDFRGALWSYHVPGISFDVRNVIVVPRIQP